MREVVAAITHSSDRRRAARPLDVLGVVGSNRHGLRVGAVWFVDNHNMRGHVSVSNTRRRNPTILPQPQLEAHYSNHPGSRMSCIVPVGAEWMELGTPSLFGRLGFQAENGGALEIPNDWSSERRRQEAQAALAAGAALLLQVGEQVTTFGGLAVTRFGSLE
jgi:hypothetical protein